MSHLIFNYIFEKKKIDQYFIRNILIYFPIFTLVSTTFGQIPLSFDRQLIQKQYRDFIG